MAIERLLAKVSAVPFTSDGGVDGLISLPSTRGFKVKARVVLSANTLPNLDLEVKRVISSTQLRVGPKGDILARQDVSAYTTALNASIEQPEQNRPGIPTEQHERAVFEEEPTLAKRVIGVDEFGDFWTEDNPFPVMDVGQAAIDGIKNPYIHNLAIAMANNEYTFAVPATTKKMYIKNRGNGILKVSFVSGQSNVNFITIHAGSSYAEENLNFNSNLNIYYQSTKVNDIIEILRWE